MRLELGSGCQYICEIGAISIALFCELGLNRAVGINQENTGKGHTVGALTRFVVNIVENAQAVNVGAFFVMKQGEFNPLVFFNRLQHFDGIIGHGHHGKSHGFKLVCNIYQLHELSFTEWSPVKRTAEHEQHAVLAFQIFEATQLTILVLGCDFRQR